MPRTDYAKHVVIMSLWICSGTLAAGPNSGGARAAPEQPAGPASAERSVSIPADILAQPKVASFVDWLHGLPLADNGLQADNATLLAQLMVVRALRLESPADSVDQTREIFTKRGVPPTALETDVARQAVQAWFDQAVGGERLTSSRYRMIRLLAEGGFGITPRRPAIAESELVKAQLAMLSRMAEGASPSETQAEIARYQAQGFPREAFDLENLQQAALRATAANMLARPALAGWEVVKAKTAYGIDPEALYAHLPASQGDIGAEITKHLEESSRTGDRPPTLSWSDLSNRIIRPEDARTIIATTEQIGTKAAAQLCQFLLMNDWSSVGRDFLYGKLMSLDDAQDQLGVLGVLEARDDFSAVQISRFLARGADPRAVDMVFRFAGGSLLHASSRSAAREFLLEQLTSPEPQYRIGAIRALVLQPGIPNEALLQTGLNALRNETPPEVRSQIVHAVAGTRRAKVVDVLLDWMKSDASADVRQAIVEELALSPMARSSDPHTARVLAALRDTAANDGAEPVRAAAKRRLLDHTEGAEREKARRTDEQAQALSQLLDELRTRLQDPAQATTKVQEDFDRLLRDAERVVDEYQGVPGQGLDRLREIVKREREPRP